ncbi:uncharacterized protein LOC136025976 isoform X3 [Artemia franciscana]|uniref:uncharacterized protein LOC136025976 isoform X3 n=1 Tax=Artemia franciscana TaxID=6661 RepID=UPI0032DBC693
MKLSISAYRAGSAGTERIYSSSSSSFGDSPPKPTKPGLTLKVQEGLLKPILSPIPSQGSVSCGLMTSAESLSDKPLDQEDLRKNEKENNLVAKESGTEPKLNESFPKQRPPFECRDRSRSVGERQWSNLRAVVALYTRLRRIKRTRSNQRWMKLRTTVQLTGAITASKKTTLKREDSFLKKFSTRQVPEIQDTFDNEDEADNTQNISAQQRRRKRRKKHPWTVINPDGNFYFYWLGVISSFVLYYLWALIVRQAFPELQDEYQITWFVLDTIGDIVYILDLLLQFRTGYLEQGLIVEDTKKLAVHYMKSRAFLLDVFSIIPLHLVPIEKMPVLRFPKMVKVYRLYSYYYIVESRTVYPNIWRVLNLVHILLLLAHWFGCFYYLISEAEGFRGDWAYPFYHEDDAYRTLLRKYLGSVYWSTLTLTTIGDLPTPYSNAQYIFTIASYLIGVFIFATIVGQVGNVITNRNASRLEFERLLDSAKLYMRHHKVPRDMQRRVQRWYDYSWSRGRIQGGGDISSALRVLPDKLKTELALHVNLVTLKKVSIFHECQPEFLHDLVLKMRASIFTPGDMICRRGEVAREMFIIADGILEVISEMGKVLTTMKSGEFFGEIGILNLDGLNKRTADVRSVGYSELFSLSREDVLSAMKDYPEARELLQSMGKKRLAEAKRIASQHKKKAEAKASGASKLLHDVKGFKDVITKTKIFTVKNMGSNESTNTVTSARPGVYRNPSTLDIIRKMQSEKSPVRSTEALNKDHSPLRKVRKRRFLRRMPRVSSDEDTVPAKPRITFLRPQRDSSEENEVIGAGLPLLQRLKLLKEKQDREEKNKIKLFESEGPQRSVEDYKKTNQTKFDSESVDVRNEAIGAGLSLLQRLNLVKQKEEGITTKSKETLQNQSQASNHVTAIVETQVKLNEKNPYPNLYMNQFQRQNDQVESSETKTHERRPTDDVKPGKPKPWSFAAQMCKSSKVDTAATKPAQVPVEVMNSGDSEEKTKVDYLIEKLNSPEKGKWDSIADAVKQETILVKEILPKFLRAKENCKLKKSENRVIDENPTETLKIKKQVIIRESPILSRKMVSLDNDAETPRSPRSRLASDPTSQPMNPRISSRPEMLHLEKPRIYLSVDDLSPEFIVLPFVKRLKILNERQKLAELEKEVKTVRSKSVDFLHQKSDYSLRQIGGSLESVFDQNISVNASDTHAISQMTSSSTDPDIADTSNWIPTFLNIMMSALKGQPPPSKKKLEHAKNLLIEQINRSNNDGGPQNPSPVFPSISEDNGVADELPFSPEENETLERRSLKSILKRLSSKDLSEQLSMCGISGKRLLRSQTVEGYAARHSKFLKAAAFQRETLSSPSSQDSDFKRSVSAPPGLSEDVPNPTQPQNLQIPEELCTIDSFTKFKLKKKEGRNNSISSYLNNLVDKQTDDRISEMILRFKELIQSRMDDLEVRFQEKLSNLESEIQEKDSVIAKLESKLMDKCTLEEQISNEPSNVITSISNQPLHPLRQRSVVTSYSSDMGEDLESNEDEDDNDERENYLVRGESFDSIIYRSSSHSNLADLEEDEEYIPSSWEELSEEEIQESRGLPPAIKPLSVKQQFSRSDETIIQIEPEEDFISNDMDDSSSEEEDEMLSDNWELALLAKEIAKQTSTKSKNCKESKVERLKRKAESGKNLTRSEKDLLEMVIQDEEKMERKKTNKKSRSLDEAARIPVERSYVSKIKQSIPESKSLSPSTLRTFQKIKRTESLEPASKPGMLQKSTSIDIKSKPISALYRLRRNLKRSMTSSISRLTDIQEDEANQGKRSISSHNLAKQRRESVEMREIKSIYSRRISEAEPLLGMTKVPH